jgi:hypothetical protein
MAWQYRPSSIVLSTVALSVARAAAETIYGERTNDPADTPWDHWGATAGNKGYVAIYNREPGDPRSGEQELAAKLSREHPGIHYVLTLAPYAADPDHGVDDIDVYEGGVGTGRLAVCPAGRLATHFGCEIPNLDPMDNDSIRESELVPFPRRPERRAGDRTLLGNTIERWAYFFAHDSLGAELGLRPPDFGPAVDALGDADVNVRYVAARLLYYGRPYSNWLERMTEARRNEGDARVRRALDDAIEYWHEWLE